MTGGVHRANAEFLGQMYDFVVFCFVGLELASFGGACSHVDPHAGAILKLLVTGHEIGVNVRQKDSFQRQFISIQFLKKVESRGEKISWGTQSI